MEEKLEEASSAIDKFEELKEENDTLMKSWPKNWSANVFGKKGKVSDKEAKDLRALDDYKYIYQGPVDTYAKKIMEKFLKSD